MELRRLRYFVTVADEGSISAAARKLYMSQPPLSAQLRLLEQEVGCPLLERGARSVRLTAAGQVLYERARELLELEQSARQEVQACGVPAEGTVRLGVVSSVASTRLPGWLAGFAAEHPLVRLQLVERDTFGLLELLRAGRLQAAIVRTPCPDEGLGRVPLAQETLVAAARALPEGELTPAVLAAQPLILYRRWEELLRARFERAGTPFLPRCVCDDARTAVQLAAAGIGTAIVPASAAAGSGLAVRPVEEPLHSGIQLVYRPDSRLPDCTRKLVDWLREK